MCALSYIDFSRDSPLCDVLPHVVNTNGSKDKPCLLHVCSYLEDFPSSADLIKEFADSGFPLVEDGARRCRTVRSIARPLPWSQFGIKMSVGLSSVPGGPIAPSLTHGTCTCNNEVSKKTFGAKFLHRSLFFEHLSSWFS